jgi:hypothetical protein
MRAIAAAMPDQQTIFLLIDLAEEYEKRAGARNIGGRETGSPTPS